MHKLTKAASIGTSGNGGPGTPGGRCSPQKMETNPAPLQREDPGCAEQNPRARQFREPHPKTFKPPISGDNSAAPFPSFHQRTSR